MEKTTKILLVIAIILLIGTSAGTYAIYRANTAGTATVTTAAFQVKANSTNVTTGSFAFGAGDITWTKTNSAVSGKIAPGATGVITLELDATGSEVDVDYTVTLGTIQVNGVDNTNAGITITGATANDTEGTISYSTTANAMKRTITLNVTWTGFNSDQSEKDEADLTMSGGNITIPVTVSVKQHNI